MSAQHTPGPWHVRHLHGRNEFGVFHYPAMFSDKSRTERVDNRCGEFKEADANLIAAAPDMLELLRSVVANSSVQVKQPDLCEQIEAAIAKATGGAQQ